MLLGITLISHMVSTQLINDKGVLLYFHRLVTYYFHHQAITFCAEEKKAHLIQVKIIIFCAGKNLYWNIYLPLLLLTINNEIYQGVKQIRVSKARQKPSKEKEMKEGENQKKIWLFHASLSSLFQHLFNGHGDTIMTVIYYHSQVLQIV